ncbi:MAG: hypothetical protein PHI70_04110 [Proteiniphilum sp.]|nr:hypothetical protein [Proteiniphilum sp.]MDD3908625.1 hypothetical protein [Proteiniphilum sp.]MDD4415952.1 hypothetical protein [Proteiniphilum sp.]
MRKKLVFLLVLVSVFCTTIGCTNKQADKENLNELNLKIYLNKDDQIIEAIKKQPIGARGPKLIYAYKQYAVILNFNGILIYDFDKENIIHTIDNMSLGVNKMQGSDYTIAKSNNEEIALGNTSAIENSAYVYNMQKNELQASNAKGIEEFKEIKHVDKEELPSTILNGNAENAVYNEEGNIVLLTYRYEDGTDSWILSILEKDSLELIKQVNVFK